MVSLATYKSTFTTINKLLKMCSSAWLNVQVLGWPQPSWGSGWELFWWLFGLIQTKSGGAAKNAGLPIYLNEGGLLLVTSFFY